MKSGRAHSVPLAPRVLEILHRAKGLSDGGPYVFPGRAPTTPLWNMVLLILLRRLQRDHLTVHGFRSTFRDWAAERTNVPRAVCEAVLAHTLRDKAEAAYKPDRPVRAPSRADDNMGGLATAQGDDVVSIRA